MSVNHETSESAIAQFVLRLFERDPSAAPVVRSNLLINHAADGAKRFLYNLNPANVEFAEDARRQWRRRTRILQALANAADSAKSTLPEGKLFSKNQTLMVLLKLMRAI